MVTMTLLTSWRNRWWRQLVWECYSEEIGKFYAVWFANGLQVIVIQQPNYEYPAYYLFIGKDGKEVTDTPLQRRTGGQIDGINPDVVTDCLREIGSYHAAGLVERVKNMTYHFLLMLTEKRKGRA